MTHHLIKKYPNRRLYDTQTSKYITLTHLRGLITSGSCVKIVDSGSNEDITRSVLLQIIIEAEAADDPMFSAETLQQIIRFYGGTLQGVFAKYLEESLQLFMKQQMQMKDTFGTDPVKAMTSIAEQNMSAWTEFQSQLFGMSTPSKNKNKPEE